MTQMQLLKGWRLCGGGVVPPTQEVGRAIVLCSGTDIIVCVLMLSRLCCVCGNVRGLPAGFQLSVKFSLKTGVLKEQDGAALGILAPPFWPSFWYIKVTLAATPLQWT